ncbi:translation initiation factor IF-2-like [Vulpes lagopus]|uniref:translation initiation factor IF-2-like n=1 Tax=Vulpes lagopus TaxID=494514 RepID=UPI001BC92B6B|nr:translation initiation factor IF-2-like [Vulpes lagopus]
MATKSLVSAAATLGIERRGGQGREAPGIPGCHPLSRPHVPRLLPPPLAAASARETGRSGADGRRAEEGASAPPPPPQPPATPPAPAGGAAPERHPRAGVILVPSRSPRTRSSGLRGWGRGWGDSPARLAGAPRTLGAKRSGPPSGGAKREPAPGVRRERPEGGRGGERTGGEGTRHGRPGRFGAAARLCSRLRLLRSAPPRRPPPQHAPHSRARRGPSFVATTSAARGARARALSRTGADGGSEAAAEPPAARRPPPAAKAWLVAGAERSRGRARRARGAPRPYLPCGGSSPTSGARPFPRTHWARGAEARPRIVERPPRGRAERAGPRVLRARRCSRGDLGSPLPTSGWPSQSRRAARGPPREGANAERLRSSVGLATRPRRPRDGRLAPTAGAGRRGATSRSCVRPRDPSAPGPVCAETASFSCRARGRGSAFSDPLEGRATPAEFDRFRHQEPDGRSPPLCARASPRNGILNQSIWNHLVSTNEQITNSTTYVGSSFLFLLKHGTVVRGFRIVHLSIARCTRILGLEEI